MKNQIPKAVLIAALLLAGQLAGAANLSATLEKDQVIVKLDGEIFTSYKFSNDLKKPYLYPVTGPSSGESVTIESQADRYPHHNSLWFGCDHVNGGNYWQDTNERGQILSQGPKIKKAKGNKIVITDVCLWKQPDQEPVIRDRRAITITAPNKDLRIIDFDITLEPLTDITITNTNHSLFSGRMTPELGVEKGGVLVNAEGALSEKGTFGIASPWCDYYGARNGVTEGMAILQHPENRWYPSKWFTRASSSRNAAASNSLPRLLVCVTLILLASIWRTV